MNAQSRHEALGWLVASIHREHPGFLAEQVEHAEEYEKQNGSTGIAEALRDIVARLAPDELEQPVGAS